jgi:hypothetical protein
MACDGMPGTLTASKSAEPSPIARSWMTYRGSPFSSARGRLVSKSMTGSGARAHRKAMAEVSIGSFMDYLLGSGLRCSIGGSLGRTAKLRQRTCRDVRVR